MTDDGLVTAAFGMLALGLVILLYARFASAKGEMNFVSDVDNEIQTFTRNNNPLGFKLFIILFSTAGAIIAGTGALLLIIS